MKRTPERVAWIVLLLSFAFFCLIIVAIPLGIRWYLLYAQQEHKASVESLMGTVIVEPPVGRGPTPLSKGQSMVVSEGTVIRLDENSGAAITFFDHSFVRLFDETTVRLDRLRSPRYQMSPLPNMVYFSLSGGRVQIGTAFSLTVPLDFRVTTLQSESRLDADGSYALEASNERSEVTTYRGYAHVSAAGEEVLLGPRQRTQVALNQAPRSATGMARNLVVNGDFLEPLDESWRAYNDQGTDGGAADGQAQVITDEGRRAARFLRTDAQGNHCETVLEQALDRQLPDQMTTLVVRAMVKVRYQGLSGGGYLSSEYPLMIRLIYRDVYDSETEWVQGFYYQNDAGNPTMYGLQVPQDRWYYFESDDLLEQLPLRPYKLVRLRIYASGWDYESLISDFSLIVE